MRQTEYTYQYIKERILDGTFKPAQKILERELSEEIGVSRNTVKKALLMLEKENLVELEQNRGAKIKSHAFEEVVNYLEVRRNLEKLVIRSAAVRISDEQLAEMERILNDMKESLEAQHYDKYSTCNRMFHEIIYRASTNQQAVEIITMIRTLLSRYHFRTILIPGRSEQSYNEHLQIYESLKARDPEKACKAIDTHSTKVLETIVNHFQLLA
jgi:DNA-binding GntR family transcriptional regulator